MAVEARDPAINSINARAAIVLHGPVGQLASHPLGVYSETIDPEAAGEHSSLIPSSQPAHDANTTTFNKTVENVSTIKSWNERVIRVSFW